MFKRWLSPSLFALAALCFALPFATVSCDDAKTTFTGLQLVTHTVPHGGAIEEEPDCYGEIAKCVERKASTAAGLTLVVVLLGVALGCLGFVRGPGWCAFGGLLGFFYLGTIDFFSVTYRTGFVLSLLLVAVAGVLHLGRAIGRFRRRPRGAPLRPERALGAG